VNAPHVKGAVVMPGHLGTEIVNNSRRILGGPEPDAMSAEDLAATRATMAQRGLPAENLDDDAIRGMVKMMGDMFRDSAPLSGEQAAAIILDGVRAGKWRILVGDDAQRLDEMVRANPEGAYNHDGPGLNTIFGSETDLGATT
jgi:hypothetical protein